MKVALSIGAAAAAGVAYLAYLKQSGIAAPTITGTGASILVVALMLMLLVPMMCTRNVRKMFYRYAEPNEWLLVIENGEMVKTGIGLRAWMNPLKQTAVRFPSSVKKVVFKAAQVTKEVQGIEISGFAMWSVHRDDEGPFKYYKYAGNNLADANGNIQLVAESIVRHQVANHTIAEIMQNRELLRNEIKKEIMGAVSGWGVWIETVEISDVKISSQSLFQDLQAEFRQISHLHAEELRLSTAQKVSEQRLASELVVAKKNADTASQRQLYEAQQKLKREEEEGKLLVKQMETAHARMEQEKLLELRAEELRLSTAQKVSEQKLASELAVARAKADTDANRRVYEAQQKLKREEEEAKLLVKQMETARARMEQEKLLELKDLEGKHEVEQARTDKRLALQRQEQQASIELTQLKLEAEAKMTKTNMQKYEIDSQERIFAKLPLRDMKVHNYMGADGQGAGQLLPGLQKLQQSWQVVQEGASA